MQDQVMAWPKQSDTRQWEKPEGDDPRTLYQMMKTSVERFGELMHLDTFQPQELLEFT